MLMLLQGAAGGCRCRVLLRALLLEWRVRCGCRAGGGCVMSMAAWALGPDGDCVYAVAKNASAWLRSILA